MGTTKFQVNGNTADIVRKLAKDQNTSHEDIMLKAIITYDALSRATDAGKEVVFTKNNKNDPKAKLPFVAKEV